MNIEKKRLISLANRQLKSNKKSYIFVCISIMLCMLVLICIYNIYHSLDMDKYISKFVKTDFTLASKDYYDMIYSETSKSVDSKKVEDIEKQKGFLEGGAIYYYTERELSLIESKENENTVQEGMYNNEGYAYLDLYGIDEFISDNMVIYQGSVDYQLLKSGKYILYGLDTDDNGNVEEVPFNVGDKVTLRINNKIKEYEIMALVKKEPEINTVKYWSKLYTVYLPTSEYIKMCNDDRIMSYLFNVKDDSLIDVEQYLKQYAEVDTDYDYTTKQIYVDEYKDMQFMVKIVGTFLTLVLGIIGIINFCNVIITEIINRKKELAIMQAIGMKKEQMYFMLTLEGISYFIMSLVATVLISTIFSFTVLKMIINSIWFLEYSFSLFPLIIVAPIILGITFIIPLLTCQIMCKKGIVERIASTH